MPVVAHPRMLIVPVSIALGMATYKPYALLEYGHRITVWISGDGLEPAARAHEAAAIVKIHHLLMS